tara:strand:+ start:901 stop:1164 length:264 start_codon:yes stop_codon:yes gene_type:complete
MSKQERIKDILIDENSIPPMFLDDFDESLIGIYRNQNTGESIPTYSYLRLIGCLVEDGVSEEEAVEYIDNSMRFWTDRVIILDDTGV